MKAASVVALAVFTECTMYRDSGAQAASDGVSQRIRAVGGVGSAGGLGSEDDRFARLQRAF